VTCVPSKSARSRIERPLHCSTILPSQSIGTLEHFYRRMQGSGNKRIACTLTVLVLMALTLSSCGGGTRASSGGSHPGTPSIYSVTVSGVSGSISHSAPVTLIVQ